MKNVFLLFICILSCSFLSCQDDTDDRGLKINENGFQLSYTVPGLETLTRSEVAVEGEDRINTFYALFFENTTDGSGRFITAVDLMEEQQNPISGSGSLKINYSDIPGLSPSGSYKMLLCANLEAYHPTIVDLADLETICQGTTEAVVNDLLQVKTLAAMSKSNLPMSASIVKQGGQTLLSASLTRAVSRFDVVNHADGYELVSASLWNAYSSTLLWENDGKDFSGSRTEGYYNVNATADQIIGGLYGFENFVENPEVGDALTTALIVEMKNQATGSTEFFRINIHPENKPQELKRNNIYCSTIQEVFGSGFSSEKEAYENDLGLLAVNINGWVGVSNGSLVYDDKNTLAMPASIINLAMAGDTRTYNIFTDGEGTLELETEGIPSEVTVELINGNQVKIDAPASPGEWSGLLTFTIGNLSTSMRVEQREYIANYLSLNFDVTELPALGYEKGAVSDDIEVTSSGAWKAQIYDDNYFSFSASGNQTVFEGKPGTNLTIYTRSENKTTSNRKGFVIFTLMDDPEITCVMVIEQEKYAPYLRIINETNKKLKASAHTFEGFILESNTDWEISNCWCVSNDAQPVTIAYINDNGTTASTLKGKGTKRLKITLKANTSTKSYHYWISASTTTSPKKEILYSFYQLGNGEAPEPDPEPTDKEMWFVTYGNGNGNLANPSADGYKQFVYVMGQNMRNSAKFGNKGTVADIGKDAFQYTTSLSSSTIAKAKIIQLLNNPSSASFDKIYKAMQDDPTMFLMITGDNANTVNSILKEYQSRANAGYGPAIQVPNPANNYRPVNPQGSKLMTYIMKEGPLGQIGTGNVALRGATNTTVGLPSNAYPDTFVPIIMSNSNQYYCVFGIDPVNRLIFMGDPGIFGPNSVYSAYPSSHNFDSKATGNRIFLDHLTAWIMHATGTKGFLQKYQ